MVYMEKTLRETTIYLVLFKLIYRKREVSQEKIRSISDCTANIDGGEEITEDKKISLA